MTQELTTFNFQITSMKDALEYAKLIADSDLAPKDYRGKPGNVLIAIQYGVEIGLKPMQAIQNIAVINGRPAIWGDAMIALVQSHPVCEYIKEYIKDNTAYCTVKRRGEDDEYTYEFSKEDAKTANLLGKAGVWQQYPDRMLQMRARGFALRDKFSDVLKGIAIREEVQDYQVVDISKTDNKKSATDKITNLIENKKSPLLEISAQIEKATTIKELIEIGLHAAKTLPEENKEKMRELYKAKQIALSANVEAGEINPDDKE